jgi:hypothetical protein
MPSPECVLGRRSWSQVGQVAQEALATAMAHTNARTLVNFRNCPKRNIIEREIVHSSWRKYWTINRLRSHGLWVSGAIKPPRQIALKISTPSFSEPLLKGSPSVVRRVAKVSDNCNLCVPYLGQRKKQCSLHFDRQHMHRTDRVVDESRGKARRWSTGSRSRFNSPARGSTGMGGAASVRNWLSGRPYLTWYSIY